jgi:hypothetical protein
MMTGALTPDDGGSGEAEFRDNRGQVQSPRERAAHYRKYAAQYRVLAAGEQNESLRANLMEIVRQYEETAASLDPGPSPREATSDASADRRTV